MFNKIKAIENPKFDIYKDIKNILSGFSGQIAKAQDGEFGIATFVKNTMPIKSVDETFVYGEKNGMIDADESTFGRTVLHIKIELDGKPYSILNFHGFWHDGPKTDSPETITQSQNIIKLLNSIKGRKILCGDMNLDLDTKSIKLIESAGMRNLVKEYGISSTRTSYFKYDGKFADYIFISEGIEVDDFKVLQEEVSDHSPLYIDFS